MNKYNKWTDEQIEFVLKLREEGLTWNAIARRLEQTYSVKKTGANIRNKIVWFVEKQNQKRRKKK